MTNIELQACEAIKSLSRHAARIADADAAALRLHNEGEEKAYARELAIERKKRRTDNEWRMAR